CSARVVFPIVSLITSVCAFQASSVSRLFSWLIDILIIILLSFPTLTARYISLFCGRPVGWSLPPLWESHVCFAAKDSTSLRKGRPWLCLPNLFVSYRISCSLNVTLPICILS